jgi:SAM-dependent methyltransferase
MYQRKTLAVAIVGLSLGAGLLSLAALRWIGFLGLPPVAFLTLLLVGMPVGGLILIRIRRLRERDLPGIILVSAALAVSGALLFLLVSDLSGAQVNLSDADIPTLALTFILRFLATALTFFPLFVGYGLAEFAAYRSGLKGFDGNSGLVYALNLTGLLLAFLGYRLLLPPLGTTGLFLVGLACMLLAALVLRPRAYATVAAVMLSLGLLFVPGLETGIIKALGVKEGPATLSRWLHPPNKIIHEEWTPHCRLTVVDAGWGLIGFYEGTFYWFYLRGTETPRSNPGYYSNPQLVFSLLIQPGDTVAVLGAGGGRQVAAALRAGAAKVYAVEVIPEVLEVLAGPLAEAVENTYNDPRVELVPKNARIFLEEIDRPLDMIVVASVESHLGGMRELFEPSQVMFTREAFVQMKSRLAPGGILAVSKCTSVDRLGIIFTQSFHQVHKLGLKARGYFRPPRDPSEHVPGFNDVMAQGVYYLVLAQNGSGKIDALATVDNIFRGSRVKVIRDPPPAPGLPEITDDRAFATGMLIANLGLDALAFGMGGMAIFLLLVGLVLGWALRRTARKQSVGEHPRRLVLAPIAVGFNFMACEYLMVYRLMDRLDVPMDATFLGMVFFAALAAAGGVLLNRRSSLYLLVVSAIIALAMITAGFVWPRASLVIVSAAAFVTGSLFPRILKGPDQALVRVYVWDAYGTLWGGLAALLVPVFLGFSGLQALVGPGLILAAWSTHRATRHTAKT